MKRAALWWIPAVTLLLNGVAVTSARADTVHFKNGTSMWVEEAEVDGDQVIVTRGGRQERFPMADVAKVEKKRTNMPEYRVDVPPTSAGPPAAAPGAPGGAPAPGLGAPGAPGAGVDPRTGGVPPPGAPGSRPSFGGPPVAGPPGAFPGGPPGSFPGGPPGSGQPSLGPPGAGGPPASGARPGQIPISPQTRPQNY